MKVNKILKSMLIAGAISLPLFFSPIAQKEEITEANQRLRSFPMQIEGAEKVRKYETPGAKYCLVHISQTHKLIPMYELDMLMEGLNHLDKIEELEKNLKRDYFKINESQKSIYKILSDLNSKIALNDIWAEGYTQEPTIEEIKKEHERKLRNEEMLFENQQLDNFMYIPGGLELLAAEGKIRVLPTESYDLNQRSTKLLLEKKAKNLSDEDLRVITEDREDYALGMIADHIQPLAVMVFGAAHAWGGKESFPNYDETGRISYKDNISEWNKTHPDKKFSLIEITPKSN